MKELTFLKELMLIKQLHKKDVVFLTIVIFFGRGFKFQLYVCSGCHDLLIMSRNHNDIAILNIRCVDYRCNINEISKSDTVNLL